MRISLFKENTQKHESVRVESVSTFEDVSELGAIICGNRAWAPGLFENDYRLNANLKSIDLLVLDIDAGCTLDQATALFKDYKHLIATTKSHQLAKGTQPAVDRFRVVLFLETPATTDAEFKSYWRAAKQLWPFIDDACKDAARFFYPCINTISLNNTGALFSDRLEASNNATSSKRTGAPTSKGKLSKRTKDFLAEGAPNGSWHNSLRDALFDLKEQGYTEEMSTTMIRAMAVVHGDSGDLDERDLATIDDIYNNRSSKYPPRLPYVPTINDWPRTKETKDGSIVPDTHHPENYEHLFKVLGFEFRKNVLNDQIYSKNEVFTEDQLVRITMIADAMGLRRGKDFVYDAAKYVAFRNQFNPFKEIVESRPWDGVDRLEELLNTLSLSPDATLIADRAFYKLLFTKWLIGVVAKVYRPGQQNFVLTLQGPQGIGKSRWLQRVALSKDAFGEGSVDPTNKDHELRHLNYIIWHIPELESTTGKREAGALKDYLTKAQVSVRPAFARVTRHGSSICSFCASVNEEKFLVDLTGNRRFVVFPIDSIDADHDVNLQQVFAQAKHLFESGVTWWLSTAEQETLNRMNDVYQTETPLTAIAKKYRSGEQHMTGVEILVAGGVEHPTTSQLREIGSLLKKRGITKTRTVSDDGIYLRVYLVSEVGAKPALKILSPLEAAKKQE